MKIIVDNTINDTVVRIDNGKIKESLYLFFNKAKIYIDYLNNRYVVVTKDGIIQSNNVEFSETEELTYEIEYEKSFLIVEDGQSIITIGKCEELKDASKFHIINDNEKLMTSSCSSNILTLILNEIYENS